MLALASREIRLYRGQEMLLIYARFISRQIHVGLANENNREAKVISRQKKKFHVEFVAAKNKSRK